MAEVSILESLQSNLPEALYLHVPFCVRKCEYCDFVSFPYSKEDALRYVSGLRREAALLKDYSQNKLWSLSTIFIGGGTPTCLSLELILEIINLIRNNFCFAQDYEFTVEANPGTIDLAKLEQLRRCGVNRISLGAQALDNKLLGTLGRIHTLEQTLEAVRLTRAAGFDNINLDLIFGIPGQTPANWRHTLERALDLRPEHIAAYGLQIEEGTRIKSRLDRGELIPCGEEEQIQMFEDTELLLTAGGLKRYEISNYAVPGRECRHNLVYWHNLDYLGLGPAAHSRLGDKRFANTNSLKLYRSKLSSNTYPLDWYENITLQNDIFETIFLGLRLTGGLNLTAFESRFGRSLEELYPGVIAKLVGQGLLQMSDKYLSLTRRGVNVSNRVMSEFVPPTSY